MDSCPDGAYEDSSLKTDNYTNCSLCHSSCKKCFNYDENSCTACFDNDFLVNTTCKPK